MEILQGINGPKQIILKLRYFDIFLTIELMGQIKLTVEFVKVNRA
jgi:hypothetical protein